MPEPETVQVYVNGAPVQVRRGAMIAVALLHEGVPCRVSVTGEPRTALCGMGICFECRAEVDGVLHRRTCQLACAPGMQIRTMP